MKKTIVAFLALILAGPSAMRAEPQDDLIGKIVRISGAVNGLGVVLLFEAGSCIILEEVDGSRRQAIDLRNRDYRLAVLADNREAYVQMLSDGLTPAEPPVGVTPAPAVSAFAYLSEISRNARKRRIIAAIPCLIAGGVVSIMGIDAWSKSKDPRTSWESHGLFALGPKNTLAIGLFASGVGVLRLSLKTSAERSYDQAQKLPVEKRDVFCANVLKKESRKAQTGRIISAGLYIGLAALAACIMSSEFESLDKTYWGIQLIGFSIPALLKILLQSDEERIYRRYLKEKTAAGQSNKLVWNIGLVPRGFALGLQYNF